MHLELMAAVVKVFNRAFDSVNHERQRVEIFWNSGMSIRQYEEKLECQKDWFKNYLNKTAKLPARPPKDTALRNALLDKTFQPRIKEIEKDMRLVIDALEALDSGADLSNYAFKIGMTRPTLEYVIKKKYAELPIRIRNDRDITKCRMAVLEPNDWYKHYLEKEQAKLDAEAQSEANWKSTVEYFRDRLDVPKHSQKLF